MDREETETTGAAEIRCTESTQPCPPTFCVVLLVYNDLPHAKRAVDSVLAQTDEDFELVIVDNGSVDSTHRLVGRYARHPKVRVMRMARNQRSDAAQVVAEQTQSPYVSFLFGDDYYHPRRLAAARSAFERNPGAAYIFFNNRYADEEGRPLKQVPATQFGGDISALDRFGHLHHFLMLGNTLHPCGMVVKSAAYRGVGGFPKFMHRLGDLAFFTSLLAAHTGVFSPERMQSITVWQSGRNESAQNGSLSNDIVFERAAVLERWLAPCVLDNLERIFSTRQSADLRLRSHAERLWFLAHQVLSLSLPDHQIFGFRLLFQAAPDLGEDFERRLLTTSGKTVPEYVSAMIRKADVDFPRLARTDARPPVAIRWRPLLRLMPARVERELGKLLCTLKLNRLGSGIYNDAVSRR